MSDELLTTQERENPLAEKRSRLRPGAGLGALALLFFALFAWSELRLREAQERLTVLEAANRSLGEERRRTDAAATAAGKRTASMARASRVSVLAGGGAADGRIYVNDTERSAIAIFARLPRVPQATRYHLWIVPAAGGEARRVASFSPSPDGSAQVVLHGVTIDGTTRVELTSGPTEPANPAEGKVILSGIL